MKKVCHKKQYATKHTSKEKQFEQQIEEIYGSPVRMKNPKNLMLQKRPSRPSREKDKNKDKDKTIKKHRSISSSKSHSHSLSKDKKIGNNKTYKNLHQMKTQKSPPLPEKNSPKKNSKLSVYLEKWRNGDYKIAKIGLEDLLSKDKNNFIINYYLGKISEECNQDQAAKKYYKQCIKIGTSVSQQFQQLASSYLYLGNYEEVINICNILLTKKQESSNIYGIRGKAQFHLGRYGPALDSFSIAIQKNGSNFKFYQYQGDCYRMLKAYEVALNSYKIIASRYQIENICVLKKQAQCYSKLGKYDKYQKALEKIQQLQNRHSVQYSQGMKIQMPKIQKKQKHIPTQEPAISINQTLYLPGINNSTISKGSDTSVNSIQCQINKGQYKKALNMIDNIMQSTGNCNLKQLQMKARILYHLGNYDSCQEVINNAIRKFQSPEVPLITFLIPDQTQTKTFMNMKSFMQKLKELNAYSLTQSEDEKIIQRRKRCIQQALNVFKGSSRDSSITGSHLNIIMEQSSVGSSRLYDSEPTSIFILRNLHGVLSNWCNELFSLESLIKTANIAYKMVKLQPKQFSIIPLHIMQYTIKAQNQTKTFSEVNKEVENVLSQLMTLYPPSQKKISKSTIKSFDIEWENKKPVNLFKQFAVLKNFKQIHKALETLAEKAQKQYYKMHMICNRNCVKKQKNSGFGFKIGLKLQKDANNQYQERVLCRIIEKMFKKQIAAKKQTLFQAIKFEKNKGLDYYSSLIHAEWQKLINSIIAKKIQANQSISCFVSDLVRAKCMFFNVKDIKEATLCFIKSHENKEIQLLQIDNRLNYRTKDVVLKFKIDQIVAELQLALQFQSLQNQFSHGLYELARSPFGGFFASLMWFSGFALKNNRLFYRQRIKWELKGLQNLRKYIYEEQLVVTVYGQNQKAFKKYILSNFDVNADSIHGYLTDLANRKYLCLKNQQIDYCQDEPAQRFVMKVNSKNLIVNDDEFLVMMRIENTSNFITLGNQQLQIISLQNSIGADLIKIRIQGLLSYEQHQLKIKQAKQMQKKVYHMLHISEQ